MFICEKCHTGPRQGVCGIGGSVGPCECCGYTRVCAGCQCDHPVKRPTKRRVKATERKETP